MNANRQRVTDGAIGHRATSTRRPRLRKVIGLVVAMLALGTLAVTPSTAAQFLTKKKADKRYLGNTSEVTNLATVASNRGTSITALCPPGHQAIGGGADSPANVTTTPATQIMLSLESKPVASGARAVGWTSEVFNGSSTPMTITVHAVCVP